jgi:hypothetical protein
MAITYKPLLDSLNAGLERNNIESLEALAVKARCEADDPERISAAMNVLDYGRYLADARRAVDQAMEDLKGTIRVAAELGLSVSFLAEAGGVTRQTVYTIMSEKGA